MKKVSREETDYLRNQLRRGVASSPCSNRLSSSGRKQRLGPSPCGHPKVPFSRRFAQTHSPLPSKRSTLSRLRLRFTNKKRWPDRGSWASTLCTRAEARNPLRPLLRSEHWTMLLTAKGSHAASMPEPHGTC